MDDLRSVRIRAAATVVYTSMSENSLVPRATVENQHQKEITPENSMQTPAIDAALHKVQKCVALHLKKIVVVCTMYKADAMYRFCCMVTAVLQSWSKSNLPSLV